MKDLLILLAHLLTTVAKLLGPSGAKAIVADSLLMKQQLLIMNRARRRAPIFRHSSKCFRLFIRTSSQCVRLKP